MDETDAAFGMIERALLATPLDPADYFSRFVFTIAALNTRETPKLEQPPVWVGVPKFRGQVRLGAALVAWRRMRRVSADVYGIAEVAMDARGQRRLFLYLAHANDSDPGYVATQTRVYQFGFNADGVREIVPLDPDDWLLSDSIFLEPPDPIYWQLFHELSDELREAAALLEERRNEDGTRKFDIAAHYLEQQKNLLRVG